MTELAAAAPPDSTTTAPSVFQNMLVHAQDWITGNLLSLDSAIQFGIILGAFILGSLIARTLMPRILSAIEFLRPPGMLRGLLHNLRRLLAPLLSLLVLFVILVSIAASGSNLGTLFIDTVMRLTAAWVIIRIAVQLVSNPFMRNVVAAMVWTIAALSIFGVLDDAANALDSLAFSIGTYRLSALTTVKCLIATLLLMYAATTLSRFVERQLGHVPNMAPGSRVLLSKIIRLLLMVVAVLIGITMAGVDLSVLAVFSGAIGLGVGFGLQRGVSNLFTGMMLLIDKTVQPGDVLELENGTFGIVHLMGSRCTEVLTLDKKSHLIPNEELVTKPVINWSRGGSESLLTITFGVDYKHNPHDIITLTQNAVASVPRVLKNPAPGCQLMAFGDSSLDFALNFWINDPQNGTGNVKSDAMLALWDAFDKNSIEIPYPHQQVVPPK